MLRDIFNKGQSKELVNQILSNYEQRANLLKVIEDEDPLAALDAPEYVKGAIERLHTRTFSDVTEEFKDCSTVVDYFQAKMKENFKANLIGEKGVTSINLWNPQDIGSYEQAGSQLRKLFASPWNLHSFISDAYWVAAKARRELYKECYRDGFALVADSKVGKRRIKQCYEVLQSIDFEAKRNKIRDNIAWCGNSVQKKVKNKSKGVLDLELLVMAKMFPVFSQNKDEIVGYNYYLNPPENQFIPADEVDHIFTYSASSNVIAQPTLNPLLVLIEACLASQVYQNTVMQKGGLLRGLFVMKELSNGKEIINDKTYMELAETMTKFIEKRFGGIRGSGQLGFAPFVDKFIDLSNIKDMDTPWNNLNHTTAIATCSMLGVPPERLGLQRGSQYKNEAEIVDSVSLGFDNELYYTLGIVDKYLNSFIADLGFPDIHIEVDGEFSSISVAAAEFGYKISQMAVPIMTVNEFRTKVLKWAPLDGPEGDEFIGKLETVSDVAKAIGPAAKMNIRHILDREVIKHSTKDIIYY